MLESVHPIIYIFSVISIGFVLRWYIPRRELMSDAEHDYEERVLSRTSSVKGVDKTAFVSLYFKAHEARWALYFAAALMVTILVTPLATIVLDWFWPVFTSILEDHPVYERGYEPWMFFMFFGHCFIWALVAALSARVYHARSPEPFLPALSRARGEPYEDIIIKKERPAWAKKARPSWAPKIKPSSKASQDPKDT